MRLKENSILLIRHAQSQHHVNGMTGGWTDTPLTRLGFRQAGRLGLYLAGQLMNKPERIFTSDLMRAAQTARPLSCLLDIPVEPEAGLREYNNGQAAGMTQAAAQEIQRPSTGTNLDWQPWPQAETWRQFYRRVSQTMQSLVSAQTGPLVIVSHGGTILNIVFWWLQLEEDLLENISFMTEPASLTLLGTNRWDQRQIDFLNRCDHLGSLQGA